MATRHINAAALAAIAVAVAVGGILASTWSGTPLVGYDDANIFFVYARNLVEGHGFVYNVGGERVEGFTSLLWVLICAAAWAASSRFEILLFVINVVMVSFALWRLAALLADVLARFEMASGWRAALLAIALALAVGLAPGYVIWTVVSLMDSGLWSALLLLAAIATVRLAIGDRLDGRVLASLMVVLVITRPEALLWGPVFIAMWIAVDVTHGDSWMAALRRHSGAVIAFIASTASLFAWRLFYFGYPFPNTYYAKAGDPLGARLEAGSMYLLDFVLSHPAFLLAVPAALATAGAAFMRYRQSRDQALLRLLLAQSCVLVMLLVGAAIPALEGGDHFGFWRMYQPILPLVAIQAVLSSAMLGVARPAERRQAAAACMLAVVIALPPWRHWAWLDEIAFPATGFLGAVWTNARVEIAIAEDTRRIGAAFDRAFADPKPSVGVIVAGGFAYSYRGPTVDLMGLNNVAMAHSPGPRTGMRNHAAFNHDVFFALAPDVLMVSLWSPDRPDWFQIPMMCGEFETLPYLQPTYFQRRGISMDAISGGFLKNLLHMPRTGELYQWAAVRPESTAPWIHAVFRREYLKELETRGYEIALPGPPR